MKFKYLLLFFSIIILSNAITAYTIGFDYAHVRTSSHPIYMPYQYADVYDTIDLRYSIYGTNFASPVNVIVSPKVYGINPFGQRIFVHNIQTHSFILSPYSNYVYSYNPMFYFDPSYQSYEVVLDLQSSDGTYQTTTSSYIYSQGTTGGSTTPLIPPTPPQNIPTCDDFYVSGFSDIYLTEDKRDFYNLYIINTIDKPLNITSVTTNPINPTNLKIENISYPFTISPYQTRSAQIDLFADTVSSTYTNFFDIRVIGKYENLTCEKVYNVRYRINDSYLPNTAECSDLRISNNYFNISSNDNKSFEIDVLNKSLDYYFEVENIRIDKPSNSILDVSLRNSIFRIYEDSKKSLTFNVRSGKTDFLKTENLTLRVEGFLKRENREDKRCRINETITVRVSPTSQNFVSNECKDITIFTRNLNLQEKTQTNFSKENGFYIFNNSNKKFTITGINHTDNTLYTDIFPKPINYTIYPKSDTSLNFDIRTTNIPSNITSVGNISIQGNFENGDFCSYSAINTNYNILINKDSICSNIGFNDSYFKDGENFITIYNNSSVDFSLNDVIFENRRNTNINIIDKSLFLPKNSQRTIRVGTSNPGSFELLAKGLFSNGVSCDYKDTKSGFFTFEQYSFENSCDFTLNYPNSKYISLDNDFVQISFKNLTNKTGSIKVTSTGAVIQEPIIPLSGYDNFSKQIDLLNIKNPKNVIYTVTFNGCEPISYFTNLYPVTSSDQEIYFTTYVSKISSNDKRITSNFSLKNTSFENKTIEVKFSGFPEDFVFVKSENMLNKNIFTEAENKNEFLLSPSMTKNIYFGIIIPDNSYLNEYNGYIEIYNLGRLILKEPFLIDRGIVEKELLISSVIENVLDEDKTVLLTLTINNSSSLQKNLLISFEDVNSFEIQGDLEFGVDAFTEVSKNYKIKYDDLSNLKYKIYDLDTYQIIKEGEYNLKEVDKPGILTGFFSFKTASDIILFVILILLIALLIYFISRRYSKKKDKVTDNVEENVVKKENLDLKTSIVEEEDINTKQVTLKELETLDIKN